MYANRTERDRGSAGIGVRVAVYPGSGGPEVSEVSAASPQAASGKITKVVIEKVRELGGSVPEEALRELIENLIHAQYRGVVISVLEEGDIVRISDKGSGIEHKERAFEFGFSGATPEVVGEIRGVGAGLGIARRATEKMGGTVTLEDNIGGGTVATISVGAATGNPRVGETNGGAPAMPPRRKYPDAVPKMNISERQQKVLITVLECGEVGPSTVAERLEISVSTAYRDLSALEEQGLVVGMDSGKRRITPLGRDVVGAIINDWVK